jgi:hypothetical protein
MQNCSFIRLSLKVRKLRVMAAADTVPAVQPVIAAYQKEL